MPSSQLSSFFNPIDSTIVDFETETANAAAIQTELLSRILSRNADTEYLRKFGLNGRTDAASFKQTVPLVTHSELKPYFDRIADGDRSPLLTADPVQTLSMSSGTTSDGQQKYLILYKEILEASAHLAKISSAYRARAFPIRAGGMFLELIFTGKLSTTRGGLASGTATTHLFRSKEFKQKQKFAGIRTCTPDEVVRHSDNRQAMYCHLLSALLSCEELEFITSTFAYTIVEAFHTFEHVWKNLCDDIRNGELGSWITDVTIRAAMSKVMGRPNPKLADVLVEKCLALGGEGDWYGVIPHLWPNCKYILSIMTGSMGPYLKRLHHYAGSLPLVSADYGATESWVGVNANPKAEPRDVTFTVVPSFAYFEFIPMPSRPGNSVVDEMLDAHDVETDNGEASPVGLTEVKVGQEYEVVLTTYGGLYRYRLGDIVRVTGFMNASPQLAYVCRKNVLLTVNIDKNTEKDVHIAINEGMEQLQKQDPKAELVDFTTYADLSSTPGHYVVFWELKGGEERRPTSPPSVEEDSKLLSMLEKCASAMDLAFLDPGYLGSRKIGTIGALELCVVEPGTFRFLLDRYLKRGIAITQYKTPRCITSGELISILRSRARFSVSSSAYV